jgi:hypothetical protein
MMVMRRSERFYLANFCFHPDMHDLWLIMAVKACKTNHRLSTEIVGTV